MDDREIAELISKFALAHPDTHEIMELVKQKVEQRQGEARQLFMVSVATCIMKAYYLYAGPTAALHLLETFQFLINTNEQAKANYESGKTSH